MIDLWPGSIMQIQMTMLFVLLYNSDKKTCRPIALSPQLHLYGIMLRFVTCTLSGPEHSETQNLASHGSHLCALADSILTIENKKCVHLILIFYFLFVTFMSRTHYCFTILKQSYFIKKILSFLGLHCFFQLFLSHLILCISKEANVISVLTFILMNALLFHLFFICTETTQYFYIVPHFLFD